MSIVALLTASFVAPAAWSLARDEATADVAVAV
jgi:hypothetical protein